MLRIFKLKMLGVIVLMAVVGLMMQSDQSRQKYIQPSLRYIMDNKYDVGTVLTRYLQIPGWGTNNIAPVSAGIVLSKPCDYQDIELHYGWHWDLEEKKNKFNPGIQLSVADNTEVKPIMSGQVVQVSATNDNKTVLIKHDSNLYSFCGGLQQVLVTEGTDVQPDTIIGKTGSSFYFEIRGQDGPVDPQSLFK